MDPVDVAYALERGVNYPFWAIRDERMARALGQALRQRGEQLVLAAVPTVVYFPGQVRRAVERALRRPGTDYLDGFQLGWLGRGSVWTQGIVEEMMRLREEGKVRALGVSIHDRWRAGQLARDSPLDMLMIRYNAAHRGAERDIFPQLHHCRLAVVAYTAPCWGRLLQRPRGWDGPVPTAGDCYRFCLSSPYVDVVLSGPASRTQLCENLDGLGRGPLNEEELAWMRRLGQLVHERNHIPYAPS